MTEKENVLKKTINFRTTEEMYKSMLQYLKATGESISVLMRKITYDYLKIKKFIEENGYGDTKPIKKKKPEVETPTPPEGVMFCDSDYCESPPDCLRQKESC